MGAGGGVFGVAFDLELSKWLDAEEEGGREDGNARSWRARGKTEYVVLYIFCVSRGGVRGWGGRHFGR